MTSLGPCGGLGEAHGHIEQVLSTLYGGGVWYGHLLRSGRWDRGKGDCAALYLAALVEHLPYKVHALEIDGLVLVGELDGLLGLVDGAELDVLIDALHLGKLAGGLTVGGDDTVVHEVALVRCLGIVIAVAVLVETVHLEFACLLVLIRHYCLVNPVPDTTTHTIGTALHHIPVLLEIAHGMTHSMSILAHEVGLTHTVDISLHGGYIAVHDAIDVGWRSVGTSSTFVVDGTRIKSTSCIVGMVEVDATVALVAKAP